MKKHLFFLFVSLFLFLNCFAESESFVENYFSKIPYKSAIFTQKTTTYMSGSDKPLVLTGRSYFKNGKVRSEILDEKGNPLTLSIARDGYSYTLLDIKSKKGLKAAIDPKNSAFAILMDNENRKNAVKKRDEVVNGVNCGVYEYVQVMKMLFMESKLIITEYRNSDGFVLKEITASEGADPSRASVSEVIKLEKNAVISDSKFEIPKDVVYTDMTDIAGTLLGKSEPDAGKPEKKQAADTGDEAPEEYPDYEQSENNTKKNKDDDMAGKIAGEAAGAVLKGLFGQ